MKFKKPQKTEILECDLTPMIDVVFQLIAFFMMLCNFSDTDRAEEIMLPSSVLAVPPEVIPEYKIILNLEPSGQVKFEGQAIEKIEFLNPIFTQEINNAAREGVNDHGEISVVIRAHQDTKTGLVQELITKCQESKLESFSLRVKEKIH